MILKKDLDSINKMMTIRKRHPELLEFPKFQMVLQFDKGAKPFYTICHLNGEFIRGFSDYEDAEKFYIELHTIGSHGYLPDGPQIRIESGPTMLEDDS